MSVIETVYPEYSSDCCQVIQRERVFSSLSIIMAAWQPERLKSRKSSAPLRFVAGNHRSGPAFREPREARRDTRMWMTHGRSFHFTSIPFSHSSTASRARDEDPGRCRVEWRDEKGERKKKWNGRTRARSRLTDSPHSSVVGGRGARIASRETRFGCCVSSGKNSRATAEDGGVRYRPGWNQRSRANRSRRTRPAVVLAAIKTSTIYVDAPTCIVTMNPRFAYIIIFSQ